MISTTISEPLTIDVLNALLANFSTGNISLDELWAEIDESNDVSYFRKSLNPLVLPESVKNRISSEADGSGI